MNKPQTLSDPQELLARAALAKAPILAGRDTELAPGVPGVASPSYHGVESSTYQVVVEGAPTGFLKVAVAEIRHLVDVTAAAEAARWASSLGLAPKPLFVAGDEGAILFEHLGEGWRVARIDDLRRPDIMAGVIAAHRSIAEGEPLGRDWNVFDGIGELWAAFDPADPVLPPDGWWLKQNVDAIGEAIAAAGSDLKPAHADPHASNLMIGPGGALRLVDFDMAANVDPYYQLGALMNEAYQFDTEMRAALEMFDGAVRESAFQRCRAYAAADDLYWALRSLLLDRLHPRRGLEFRKYASWRFLRCRMLVGRPGFEEALRSL